MEFFIIFYELTLEPFTDVDQNVLKREIIPVLGWIMHIFHIGNDFIGKAAPK